MPLYDYYCEANGRHFEVRHRMSESIGTWGELCERTGEPLGDVPADAPVVKQIGSGSALNRPDTLSRQERPRAFDSATVMPMRTSKF